MPIQFTMLAEINDFQAPALVGATGMHVHFDLNIAADDLVRVTGENPMLIAFKRVTGYIRSDGNMYDTPAVSAAPFDLDDPGEQGVRLLANDPDFHVDPGISYRVSFEQIWNGRQEIFRSFDTPIAPSVDTTVELSSFAPGPGRDVVGVPVLGLIDDLSDATEVGKEFLRSASAAAFREALSLASTFDVRLDDTRTPTDGSVSVDKLDENLSAVVELVDGHVDSPYFYATDTGNVLNSYTADNVTQKVAKFGSPHYTNSEEPLYGVRCDSGSSYSYVQIGGGSTTGNAATQVQFYTAANNTTLTGSLRGYYDSDGALAAAVNTSDQTTNYEKCMIRYNSNVLEIGHVYGGSGSARVVKLGVGASAGGAVQRYIQAQNAAPFLAMIWETTSVAGNMVSIGTTGSSCTASSSTQVALAVNPTINQSSTAGYTAILINPTETAVGSGSCYLLDAQVGGASKAYITNKGNVYGLKYTTANTYRATAAGTTTLTSDSAGTQVFTGSTTQTCKLPTTNIIAGNTYTIVNQSSGDVTVQSSGANTIATVTTGVGTLFVALADTPTTAAHWRAI